MNVFDIGIIIIIIFFVGCGIFRGFFREVGSISGLVLGIWIGSSYYSIVTEYITLHIGIDVAWLDVLSFICFALIFIIVMASCVIIGRALQWFAKAVLFGWLDRSLGATLAFVKAVLICYLIILIVTFFLPAQQPILVKSKLAPVIISLYQAGSYKVPRDTYEKLKNRFYDILNQSGKESTEEEERQDQQGEG